ncbi:hypothetical protein M434DRAFT_30524 [Hypoxylon sp. CO27-5]|nr:hypothetical protein M434DRAFT_30524 [Hypoxylon sp. CO27-5]
MNPRPSFDALPVEVIIMIVSPMIDDDAESLVNLIIAHPGRFFNEAFNIADFAADRYVRYMQSPGGTNDRKSVLSSVIANEYAPVWLIRRCMDSLVRLEPGAINGLYKIPQLVEPPIHTAVRIGRLEAVKFLLQYPGINPNVRYWHGRHTLNPFCAHQGFPHLPPCNPEVVLSRCLSAPIYAVEAYSDIEDADLRHRIHQCAIALALANWVPQSITTHNMDFSITEGLRLGMSDYVTTVLTRMFSVAEPGADSGMAWYNVSGLLLGAVKLSTNTNVVQLILKECRKFDIFPMVQDTNPATNLIYTALSNSCDQSAILILQYIKDQANNHIAYRPHDYVAGMMGSDRVIIEATRDGNFLYFLEHMKFLREALSSSIPETEKEQYRQILELTIHRAQTSQGNRRPAVHLVQEYGYDRPIDLREAIRRRDISVIDVIVSAWKRRGDSLEVVLPVRSPADVQESALRYCARTVLLVGVVILLNAGADPKTISPREWEQLGEIVQRQTEEMNELEFYQRNLLNRPFENDQATFGAGVEDLDKVRPFLRLIFRIIETNSAQ